jgi:hypothetical protein
MTMNNEHFETKIISPAGGIFRELANLPLRAFCVKQSQIRDEGDCASLSETLFRRVLLAMTANLLSQSPGASTLSIIHL